MAMIMRNRVVFEGCRKANNIYNTYKVGNILIKMGQNE